MATCCMSRSGGHSSKVLLQRIHVFVATEHTVDAALHKCTKACNASKDPCEARAPPLKAIITLADKAWWYR